MQAIDINQDGKINFAEYKVEKIIYTIFRNLSKQHLRKIKNNDNLNFLKTK